MQILHRTELVDIVKHFKLPLIAVEIGVAEGYHSADLLKGGLEKLFSIDNWETINGAFGDGAYNSQWHDNNYKAAIERLAPFGDKSIILKGMSDKMADHVPDNSIGLLYLDGNHSYQGVMDDLNNYFSKVVDGGVISGHDYLNPSYGVKTAVDEFCEQRGYKVNIIPELKDQDASFWFIKMAY